MVVVRRKGVIPPNLTSFFSWIFIFFSGRSIFRIIALYGAFIRRLHDVEIIGELPRQQTSWKGLVKLTKAFLLPPKALIISCYRLYCNGTVEMIRKNCRTQIYPRYCFHSVEQTPPHLPRDYILTLTRASSHGSTEGGRRDDVYLLSGPSGP